MVFTETSSGVPEMIPVSGSIDKPIQSNKKRGINTTRKVSSNGEFCKTSIDRSNMNTIHINNEGVVFLRIS